MQMHVLVISAVIYHGFRGKKCVEVLAGPDYADTEGSTSQDVCLKKPMIASTVSQNDKDSQQRKTQLIKRHTAKHLHMRLLKISLLLMIPSRTVGYALEAASASVPEN